MSPTARPSPNRSSPNRSPLWPAQLDHIQRTSDRPEELVRFYGDALGLVPQELGPSQWLVHGPGRRLLIAGGPKGAQPPRVFPVQTSPQLAAPRAWPDGPGIPLLPLPAPAFARGLPGA